MYKSRFLNLKGVTNHCIREIWTITKIEITKNGKEEMPFCIVQTLQEYHWNGELDTNRKAEQMIAFGDCAKMLQNVDYGKHEISLSWFVNTRNENIIIGFAELDRRHKVYTSYGFGPATITEWKAQDVNEKLKPLTNVSYVGFARYSNGSICGDRTYGAHTKEEILTLKKTLRPNEYIQCVEIRNYGPYTKYRWFNIK